MIHKVLFVGEAPTPENVGSPLDPHCCDSGRRLLRYTGWEVDEFLHGLADRTNVFPWPMPRWAPADARQARLNMQALVTRYERVVLLGRKVASAFQHDGEFFAWQRWFCVEGGVQRYWAVCPHPSGANRWWNDPDNVKKARRFFNRLATDLS